MTGWAARLRDEAAAAAPKLFVAFLVAFCIAGLWRVAATIGLHVPFDPNEGWNAYHASAAISGRALYPDAHAYMTNNYPPLSFYFVGALGRLLGDTIVAGRLVSLLAFFAIAGTIAQTARIMGCSLRDAAIAALLFMAFLLVGSDYVGMDDPQLLGHALGLAGLLFTIREPRAVVAGAAFLVVALFVKHNLVALPLALALWLLLYDRPGAWRFIAAGVVLSLLGLLAFRIAFGSNLLSHLASSRTYSFALLADGTGNWLVLGAVPLAIAAALFTFFRGDRYVVFCALYGAIALVLGVAFAGGAGVDTNAFFDADMALALGCGLAFDRWRTRGAPGPALLALALVLPLCLCLYLASDEDWPDPDFWFHPMADEARLAHADIVFLEQHRGAAMCEMLSLCYWAGKKAEVDLFNTEQQYLTGARSDDDLVRRIETRRFAVVQLDALDPFPLSPRIRTTLLRNYRIDHSDDEGVFLVPMFAPH